MNFLEKTAETLKTAQIYPSKVRIEPNDKTAKALFNLDAQSYGALMLGAKGSVTEKKNHRKYGTITTPVHIGNAEGYNNIQPLTEFERAVLSVCISEFAAGNAYTTPAVIFRALIGKVGEDGVRPMKNQLEMIVKAIDKIIFTKFDADIAHSFEQLKYSNGDEVRIKKSYLLPACIVDAKINGQELKDIVFFDRESPIFTIANLKNQVIRYDASLLDVPNQQNTPRVIVAKNYTMRRIGEIKLHKQMSPTITFDDVFKKCRIEDAHPEIQSRVRKALIELFEHLKNQNFIEDFSLKKEDRGKGFHGISFNFKK